jgi:hypothetical protein
MFINKNLNGRCVNFVVLGMGADEADKSPLALVIELYDEQVMIAFDVDKYTKVLELGTSAF